MFDTRSDLDSAMFEVYTIVGDRVVIVAALANRQKADQYLQAHAHSCIGTLLVRLAVEQDRYRLF